MFTINLKGRLIEIDKPLVMGILNLTPDSFYKGFLHENQNQILALVEKMLKDGADIIDVGGQSTRPGSSRLSAEEELERVIPSIQAIMKHLPQTVLSIDTYHSKVARIAVELGVCLVNDISAGEWDESMISTVAALKVPYCCMHMKGRPETMQDSPSYKNVVTEVFDFLASKINACKDAGIVDVIIDPGFGFGKTLEQNYSLLKHLPEFKSLECPIMVGVSRKSMLYKTLQISAAQALNASTAAHAMALLQGANILRVHDVQEARETVNLFQALNDAP
jgi:dihydropteroate synthase